MARAARTTHREPGRDRPASSAQCRTCGGGRTSGPAHARAHQAVGLRCLQDGLAVPGRTGLRVPGRTGGARQDGRCPQQQLAVPSRGLGTQRREDWVVARPQAPRARLPGAPDGSAPG